jgi:hypothetical protein
MNTSFHNSPTSSSTVTPHVILLLVGERKKEKERERERE